MPPLERYAKILWDYWERNFSDAATENRKLKRSVNGKVVVITGASSGIGEVVAHRVGRAGATVILIARTKSKLDVIRDEIIDAGGDADPSPPTSQTSKDCQRVMEDISRNTAASTYWSTTPAARSAVRSAPAATASTTSSARCS